MGSYEYCGTGNHRYKLRSNVSQNINIEITKAGSRSEHKPSLGFQKVFRIVRIRNKGADRFGIE